MSVAKPLGSLSDPLFFRLPGVRVPLTGVFIVWAALLLALAGSARAHAGTLILSPDQSLFHLGPHVEYLEDPQGELSIDTVTARQSGWQTATQKVISFGYTASIYWVRVSLIQNHRADAPVRPYVLEVAYPVLDQVDAYVFQDGVPVAHHAMGDRLPFAQRPIDHPNFAIPVQVYSEGATEVYLRIQSSSSIQIPLKLYRNQKLVEASYEAAIAQTLFYGALLVMAMYNLLIFFTIRDISYLYFVLLVVSTATLMAGIEGLTFKYVWPQFAWINDPVLVLALAGIVTFSALFFRSFLLLPRSRPLLSKVASSFALAGAIAACAAFFLPYRPMMMITMPLAMGGILAGFWVGLERWRDGFHSAKLFNIAWSCLLLAGFLLALNKLGVLPGNWFIDHIVHIGASLQAVLLSFAMAHRMTHERRLREQAQQELTAVQLELLDRQMRTNENLDRLVRERTEELEQTNAKLKQISVTDGLTKLLNRRAFEDIFHTEYRRAYREKSSITILMIDLDHFKRINDQYGHPFGDLCLIKAAEIIHQNIRRPSDVAARYGGEEFILLLPNTDANGAIYVARKILRTLAATLVTDGEHQLSMTASIGMASEIPQVRDARERLLKAADLNLYAAKESGRNQVMWDSKGSDSKVSDL